MKQAIMNEPGEIAVAEVEAPQPGPGEALLHVKRIGVCGSDIHVWHGKHPFTRYPVVQGHEFSATVEAVGAGVTGIPVGAKVTALPQVVCGTCPPCRRGDYNICNNLKVQGFQATGAAQDYFVTAADRLVLLPDDFTFEQGAFIEPCSVAVHASGRAGDIDGHHALVIGAGTIGNLVAQAVRARGAEVMIADLSDHRLDIATRCGVEHTWNPSSESLEDACGRAFGQAGFDLAFECAGAEKPVNDVILHIQKGGTIVQVGLYEERPRIDMSRVGEHELRIVGSLMYKRPDYEKAVAWIAEGRLRLEPLESRHFALTDYADAYRYIDEQGDQSMKVFIDVNP